MLCLLQVYIAFYKMEESPLLISYKSKRYDLTRFQYKHPGGLNTLKGLNDKDIEHRFEKAPPHSDAAFYLMKEYEVKNAKEANNNGHLKNGMGNGHTTNGIGNGNVHSNGMGNGHSNNNGIGNGNVHSENVNGSSIQQKTDESMEVSADNLFNIVRKLFNKIEKVKCRVWVL